MAVSCAMISAQVGIFLNSIEMMESVRCGRRKQRNPRRKNVENGDEGEEGDSSALDKNKNKIIAATSPSNSFPGEEVVINEGHHKGHQGVEVKDHHHGDTGVDDGAHKKQKVMPDSSVQEKHITPEEKVAAILREIQSAAPDSSSIGAKTGSLSVTSAAPSHNKGLRGNSKAEEAKIAELLNRGDTAVIYPEPVSDNEEQQNVEDGGSEEEIVLKCMHCPQTFLRAIVLRDHMRDVHADKPLKFMCPKCDETFHQKSQLDKHLTLHSPTSQVCNICNKTFANVYRLQRHMISHNESTDLRKFKCPECGKAFKFKHHLKEHVRIHSGEKPFVCNNCGKRFSHSGSFSSHTTSKKCWGLSATRSREPGQTVPQNGTPASVSSANYGQKIGNQNHQVSQYSRPPVQATTPVTVPHQPHFMSHPYAAQKGMAPFFYPPQMFASPDGFLHPMYTGMQHPAMSAHLPNMGLPHPSVSSMSSASRSTRSMSPHSQSTRSFSPQSRSERSMSPGSVFSMSSPPPTPSRRSMTPGSHKPDTVTPSVTPARECPSTNSSDQDQISPDINSNVKLLNKSQTEETTSKQLNTEQNDNTNVESEKSDNIDTAVEESVKTESDEVDKTATNVDNVGAMKANETNKKSKVKFACQFCNETFENPITQHQHERYLCKHNKDVLALHHKSQVEPSRSSNCQSPHSTVSDMSHIESATNGSVGNVTDDEEVEEMYKDADTSVDEKNMRIRTQFSEDQQIYLKSQYQINPRPRKFELIRMGNRIGFPKRVVQVWFQNMRARERKYGREPTIGVVSGRADVRERDISKSPSSYIPNVPKPNFTNMQQHSTNQSTTTPQQLTSSNSKSQQKTGSQVNKHSETPLDLSVRRSQSPPAAHGGNTSRHSTPESMPDDQVLNLSLKKESSEERDERRTQSREQSVDKQMRRESKVADKKRREHSEDRSSSVYRQDEESNSSNKSSDMKPTDMIQKSFQDSPIFKYMQQEGMFLTKQHPHLSGSMSPNLALTMQNQTLLHTMASVLKMPCYKPNTELNIPHIGPTSMLFDTARSLAEHTMTQAHAAMASFTDTNTTESATSVYTYTTDSPSPLTSPSPVMMPLQCPMSMAPEDTHNLATLAEAAQQAATIMSGGKPKRLRKKTWRQVDNYMEADEVQLEEESQSTDDDQPSRKKRKSWKGHRVDREEGMYACDQCNKLFSKQSSLARHKYEHSGARPFACDMCSKSFKHKHHLTEHKRLHSGEKPFQCRKCGKRFSHSGSFSQHMNHRYNYCSPHKTSDGDCDLSSQESP